MCKKCVLLFLTFVIVFASFGCHDVAEVDVTELSGPAEISVLCDYFYEDEIRNIVSYAKHLYEDMNVEIVSLSNKPSERETQMQQIKSEIIAGKGPDVFILPCEYPGSYVNDEVGSVHLRPRQRKTLCRGFFSEYDDRFEIIMLM